MHNNTRVFVAPVVCRTASGTNTGNIRDQPPSGQHVQFSGVTLVRFNAAGQIQQSIVFRWVVALDKANQASRLVRLLLPGAILLCASASLAGHVRCCRPLAVTNTAICHPHCHVSCIAGKLRQMRRATSLQSSPEGESFEFGSQSSGIEFGSQGHERSIVARNPNMRAFASLCAAFHGCQARLARNQQRAVRAVLFVGFDSLST